MDWWEKGCTMKGGSEVKEGMSQGEKGSNTWKGENLNIKKL